MDDRDIVFEDAAALDARRALLRKPFSQDEIETLPKYVGPKDADGKIPKAAYGVCPECGRRHPMPAVHLDYVGHAGITERLNDVDPDWNWEPVAFDEAGLPRYDAIGGLWIRLTVLGVTRYGYGDAQGKTGPNAVKEIIGDAIRNAAMRFGVATYLWSKSEKAEHAREYDERPREDPPVDGPFTARCQSCGKAYTFEGRDQYEGFLADPQCCPSPAWEVV
ncbi:hypothetical protein EII22_08785 [Coriobacteriales bacterium OH1046]|nr:hypothetical protein EII22_08785 [Coriobacteriales bacterium OH1046]